MAMLKNQRVNLECKLYSKQRLLAPEVRLPKDKLQVGHMVYSYA